MARNAIRTPLAITDPGLYAQAAQVCSDLADAYLSEYSAQVAAKVARRAARH